MTMTNTVPASARHRYPSAMTTRLPLMMYKCSCRGRTAFDLSTTAVSTGNTSATVRNDAPYLTTISETVRESFQSSTLAACCMMKVLLERAMALMKNRMKHKRKFGFEKSSKFAVMRLIVSRTARWTEPEGRLGSTSVSKLVIGSSAGSSKGDASVEESADEKTWSDFHVSGRASMTG